VIDIGLPRMDGFLVARALRSQATEDGALLVALTGYSSEDIRERAREAGFDRYFVKPLDIDALLDVLVERA
jgi:DNA-binding response OmpR family regulator